VEAQQIIAACRRVYCKEVLGWDDDRTAAFIREPAIWVLDAVLQAFSARDAIWQDRVRKAVAVERERCALVCENLGKPTYFGGASHMGAFIATAPQCAAAIRKG